MSPSTYDPEVWSPSLGEHDPGATWLPDLHPTAPLSATHHEWLRLTCAIRAVEDAADCTSHADSMTMAHLSAVTRRPSASATGSRPIWAPTPRNCCRGLRQPAGTPPDRGTRWTEDADTAAGPGSHSARTCPCLERNFCPDPAPPGLRDWTTIVTIDDVQDDDDLAGAW